MKKEMDGYELRAVNFAKDYYKFRNALLRADYIDKREDFLKLYQAFCIVEAIDELGNR